MESKELEVSNRREASAEISSDDATNKLDATLPTHFESPHELETAYTNTKGDSSEGTKNIRQADNATNNVWKMDSTKISSSSEEQSSTSSEAVTASSSTTSDYSSTADPELQETENTASTDENKKRDPVVFVVDHSGQRQPIVVIDADGLQKVDEPIEDANDSKGSNRKVAIEKVFIVHANTEPTMSSSSSSSSSSGSFEQQGSSTISTSSTSADMEMDGQVFETQFYEHITTSPFDTIASKEIFGETHHSTKGPFSLFSSSSSEENIQNDNILSDLSTSGFVILDSVTDRSSAASQQSFDAQYYGTEGPDHVVSYDSKYYSNDQIEGSSSPYEFSLFGRLSTALSEGTSEPTMDISSGDAESEDELSNPFESPEFPVIPDDLTIHGMMDDDHDVITNSKPQSIKEYSTDRPSSAERILVEVLPLRSNGSVSTENDSINASTSMTPEEWLKSTDDNKSDNKNNILSDEKLNIISTPSAGADSSQITTTVDNSRSSSSFSDSYEDYTPSNSYENIENLSAADENNNKQQYIEKEPLHNFFMDTAKDWLRFQNKMFVS